MKKDSIAYTVVFTFIACALFVLGLAAANELTKTRTAANKSFAAHSAVLRAFGLAYGDRAEAESRYASQIQELPGGAWKASIEGADYYAVKQTGPGLWGPISLIVAADPGVTRIRGMEVLDQNETPGLGGRIDEPWFKEQFRGERVGEGGRIRIDQSGSGSGDQDKENGRVDAISGASRTSDFTQAIINNAIAALKKAAGGSQ